jgi:hypothetical protein
MPNRITALSDYRWLLGNDAAHLLGDLARGTADPLRAASCLRKTLSAERVHLLLEQVELRRRTRNKFARADQMFFTPLGLEQATDQWVGAYKAQRFAQIERVVWDLGCGIGGDLSALARAGTAIGVERNRISAVLAKANSSSRAVLVVADVAKLAAELPAWHIDPDRRPAGRRTTRAELHEPGPLVIERLLRSCGVGAVKLAPAAMLPASWYEMAELEWISRDGECKQLVAWFGALARRPGGRRATMIFGPQLPPIFHTVAGEPEVVPPVMSDFGRYLAEPDAAVLAAGLSGSVARRHELATVASGAVYLTGDRAQSDPALAWFEIVEILPFDVKRIKAMLRQRGVGRLEIKKRGVDVSPEQLRRKLIVPGDESATLFLVRLGSAVTAVLARRMRIL